MGKTIKKELEEKMTKRAIPLIEEAMFGYLNENQKLSEEESIEGAKNFRNFLMILDEADRKLEDDKKN